MKGTLIILVVFGHFLTAAVGSSILPARHVFEFIYSFHMPLFIFVSGLFSKGVYKNGRLRVSAVLYYLAICWLMYVALWIPQAIYGVAPEFNLLTLNGSMPWYLMVLALYSVLTPLFAKVKPIVIIPCSIVVSLVSGFADATSFLSLNRALLFLPYFLAGYYVDPRALTRWMLGIAGPRLRLLRILACTILVVSFAGFCMMDVHQLKFAHVLFTASSSYAGACAKLSEATVWFALLARVVNMAFVAIMGVCLMLLTPARSIPLLTRTGRHSLQVYVLHAFVSYVIAYLGFAAAIYELLPSATATLTLLFLSVACAFLLGWSAFPQRCFDKLKGVLESLPFAWLKLGNQNGDED